MTREDAIALYGAENKLTADLPAYIKEYERFYLLERLISNYILEAVHAVEQIIEDLDINVASGDMLNKICQRMGVEVEIPTLEDGSIDQETYNGRLRLAIIAQSTRRRSTGTRKELIDALSAMSPIFYFNIKDNSIAQNSDSIMSVSTLIVTDSEDKTVYANLLYNMLFPDVTGVRFISKYIKSGETIFSFITGDEVDYENDKDIYNERGYYVAGWGTEGDEPVVKGADDYDANGKLKPEVKDKYRRGGHWVTTKIN